MHTEQLTVLTQQSSCDLERLKEGDASAIERLQATLDQIGATIDALGDAPTPWRDQDQGFHRGSGGRIAEGGEFGV